MSASKQTAEERAARLLTASFKGETDLVKAVLSTGIDPNVRGEDGTTPLIYATYYEHPDVVDVLLENKATDTNLQTYSEGNSALIYASHSDQLMAANALLDHGANPNLKNKFGSTALDYAPVGRMHDLLVENGGTAGSSPTRANRVSLMGGRGVVRKGSRHRSYRKKNTRSKRTRRNRRA